PPAALADPTTALAPLASVAGGACHVAIAPARASIAISGSFDAASQRRARSEAPNASPGTGSRSVSGRSERQWRGPARARRRARPGASLLALARGHALVLRRRRRRVRVDQERVAEPALHRALLQRVGGLARHAVLRAHLEVALLRHDRERHHQQRLRRLDAPVGLLLLALERRADLEPPARAS